MTSTDVQIRGVESSSASSRPHGPVRHRPEIDGLRAIAVLLVVVFHASPAIVPGGFIGVDVFFVISGYLITGNILRGIDRGSFSFLDFYARRCRRIVPALVVVLSGIGVLGWYVLLPDEFKALGNHLIAGATFTTNIVLWKEAGYFDVAAETKPLLHLWSLGVEEQFYLIAPALVVAAARWRRIGTTIAALTVLSFLINLIAMPHHAVAAFYLLPSRFWEILVGGCLVFVELRVLRSSLGSRQLWPRGSHDSLAQFFVEAAAVAALVLIVGTAFAIDRRTSFPGWWAVWPDLGALILIAAGDRAVFRIARRGARAQLVPDRRSGRA